MLKFASFYTVQCNEFTFLLASLIDVKWQGVSYLGVLLDIYAWFLYKTSVQMILRSAIEQLEMSLITWALQWFLACCQKLAVFQDSDTYKNDFGESDTLLVRQFLVIFVDRAKWFLQKTV